jgi:hypothetical protein
MFEDSHPRAAYSNYQARFNGCLLQLTGPMTPLSIPILQFLEAVVRTTPTDVDLFQQLQPKGLPSMSEDSHQGLSTPIIRLNDSSPKANV